MKPAVFSILLGKGGDKVSNMIREQSIFEPLLGEALEELEELQLSRKWIFPTKSGDMISSNHVLTFRY